MADLAAIRKRLDASTTGPWYSVGPPWNSGPPFVVAGDPDPHKGSFVCDLANFGDEDNDNAVADGEFIAHARADVEALLAAVDRLAAELKAAQVVPLGEHLKEPGGWCRTHSIQHSEPEWARIHDQLTEEDRHAG